MAIVFKLPQHTLLAGIPPAPAVGSSLGDDSDSWWAGAQRCFMAIPIAATLATVALSASLCWGVQQQNEEIVPQPAAPALAEGKWIQPPVQKRASWTRVWSVDDEFVPQVVTMVEEDGWQLPPSLRRVVSAPVWQTDEEVIPHVEDGYPWTVYSPPSAPPKFLYLPDPEELPSGSLFGVPDEPYWVQLGRQAPRSMAWMPPVDEEIIPQAVVLPPEHDDWQIPTPRPQTVQARVWSVDDEIVPQAVVFRPEEDTWTLAVVQPQASWRRVWIANEPITLQPALEQYEWIPRGVNRPTLNTQVWWVDDEIVPQAVTAPIEEEVWLPPTVQQQASWKRVWVANEPIALQSTLEQQDWTPLYSITRPVRLSGPEWDDQVPAQVVIVVQHLYTTMGVGG